MSELQINFNNLKINPTIFNKLPKFLLELIHWFIAVLAISLQNSQPCLLFFELGHKFADISDSLFHVSKKHQFWLRVVFFSNVKALISLLRIHQLIYVAFGVGEVLSCYYSMEILKLFIVSCLIQSNVKHNWVKLAILRVSPKKSNNKRAENTFHFLTSLANSTSLSISVCID